MTNKQPGAQADTGNQKADSWRIGDVSTKRRRVLQTLGTGIAATPLAGCLGLGRDGDEDVGNTINVGVLAALDADLGNSARLGAEVAAQEINDDGGIAGADVELEVRDTEADPQTGQSVYQELTTGENVDVTVGTWSSEVLISILPLLSQTQTVHLSAGASTDEASRRVASDYEEFKYFFRPGPINSVHIGQYLLDFADELFIDEDYNNVAMLGENYAWADPTWETLVDGIDDTGLNVVYQERFAAGTEDFSPLFDQVESANADVVLGLMAYTSTPATVQWNSQERDFRMAGVLNSLQPSTAYENLDGQPEYALHWVPALEGSDNTELTQPFIDAYKEMHDLAPLYPAFCAYDAMLVYRDAVEEADTTDPEELISVIEETSITGSQGQIEFYDPDSEFPHDVVYDLDQLPQPQAQWQASNGGGVQEVVWPYDLATADVQDPGWL